MKKTTKIAAIVASAALSLACLAGCGGGNAASSSSAESSASSSSAQAQAQTIKMKDVTVAGVQMEVPKDLGKFKYIDSGAEFGNYIAMEDNKAGFITVSELISTDMLTLKQIDEDALEEGLFGEYTNIEWSNFETGLEEDEDVTYTEGSCTFESEKGNQFGAEVRAYDYAGEAVQLIAVVYPTGSDDSELAQCVGDVMDSIVCDNDDMATYIYAWIVYKAAGLDTAQLSEEENLEEALAVIEELTGDETAGDAATDAANAAKSN